MPSINLTPPNKKQRNLLTGSLFLIAIISLVLSPFLSYTFVTRSQDSQVPSNPTSVETIIVSASSINLNDISFVGRIENQNQINLTAEASGEVLGPIPTVGRETFAGEVLVKLGENGGRHPLEIAFDRAQLRAENLWLDVLYSEKIGNLSIDTSRARLDGLEVDYKNLKTNLELVKESNRLTIQAAKNTIKNLDKEIARTQKQIQRNRDLADISEDNIDDSENNLQDSTEITIESSSSDVGSQLQEALLPLLRQAETLDNDPEFGNNSLDIAQNINQIQELADSLADFNAVKDSKALREAEDLQEEFDQILQANSQLSREIQASTNQDNLTADTIISIQELLPTINTTLSGTQGTLSSQINQLESVSDQGRLTGQQNNINIANLEDQIPRLEENKKDLEIQIKQLENSSKQSEQTVLSQIDGLKQQQKESEISLDSTVYNSHRSADSLIGQHQLAQLDLEQARLELNKVHIKSPINGTVVEVPISVGESVSPGQTLLTVYDVEQKFVKGQVTVAESKKLQIGQEIELELDEEDSIAFQAKVRYISPVTDSESNLVPLELDILGSSKEAQELPIGSRLVGDFELNESSQEQEIIMIPLQAVEFTNLGNYVFVYDQGIAKRIEVRLGSTNQDKIEVISGLTEGQEIIFSGQQNLEDGDEVSK